jgi:hypothetical protein
MSDQHANILTPSDATILAPPRRLPIVEIHPVDHGKTDSPQRLVATFPPADLAGQFVLSRWDAMVPSGWVVHRHRGWTLGVHPWLPVTTMRASDGTEVGWLLGYPIDERAEFIEDVVRLPFASHAASDEMEAWLYRLCGRFLAIWLTPYHERVYLDAGGLLSAVFAREHDLVASTTALVPYSRGCDDDLNLLRAARIPHGKAVLSFGLTSRYGVQRLHPNHFLDLRHWTAQRHWPVAPLDEPVDPEEAIHTISRMIRRHVAAGMRHGKLNLALTAGYDSRCVLACSREHLDRIELFTIPIPDQTGRLDVDIATKMATRHGLPHQVLSYLPPSQHDLDTWLWRTGSSLSEPRGWRASRTYGAMRDSIAPEVTGAAGEAARVAYWRDSGAGKHRLTPRVFAECLKLPHTAGILASARTWMSSYPASTPVQLLDGFYIENALGVRAGTLAYGDANYVRCRLYPFINREALTVMSRLPEAYKLERRFPVDLIRHNWPELLQTPFNHRAGVRHRVDRIRRRAWFLRRALARRLSGK